jgi:hypothetical protein
MYSFTSICPLKGCPLSAYLLSIYPFSIRLLSAHLLSTHSFSICRLTPACLVLTFSVCIHSVSAYLTPVRLALTFPTHRIDLLINSTPPSLDIHLFMSCGRSADTQISLAHIAHVIKGYIDIASTYSSKN